MTFDRNSFVYVGNPFFYRTERGILRFDASELVAIKSAGKYQHLITTTKNITLVSSAAAMEASLEGLPILRIHRSWMINVHYLSFISRYRNYVCVGDLELPVGKNYVAMLLAAFGIKDR